VGWGGSAFPFSKVIALAAALHDHLAQLRIIFNNARLAFLFLLASRDFFLVQFFFLI
jgi:hypothetical protein